MIEMLWYQLKKKVRPIAIQALWEIDGLACHNSKSFNVV